MVAKDELNSLLNHNDIKNSRCPILFFANKVDVRGSMAAEQLSEMLALDTIRDRPWNIVYLIYIINII